MRCHENLPIINGRKQSERHIPLRHARHDFPSAGGCTLLRFLHNRFGRWPFLRKKRPLHIGSFSCPSLFCAFSQKEKSRSKPNSRGAQND